MKNEIEVKKTETTALVQYSSEMLDLIRKTVAQDCTPIEFDFFIAQCKRTGLDPISRQIYAIKINGKVVTQTSIDGFRLIAARSNDYEGQTQVFWCGKDGHWRDVWISNDPPVAAKIGIYRTKFREPLFAVAHFHEYARNTPIWKEKPALMLAKVCESLALRKAFPNDLSGLYTPDELPAEPREVISQTQKNEIKQAVKNAAAAVVNHYAQQAPIDVEQVWNPPQNFSDEMPGDLGSAPSGEYVIPFGKHKGQTIEQVGLSQARNYMDYLLKKLGEEGKSPRAEVQEFFNQVESRMR